MCDVWKQNVQHFSKILRNNQRGEKWQNTGNDSELLYVMVYAEARLLLRLCWEAVRNREHKVSFACNVDNLSPDGLCLCVVSGIQHNDIMTCPREKLLKLFKTNFRRLSSDAALLKSEVGLETLHLTETAEERLQLHISLLVCEQQLENTLVVLSGQHRTYAVVLLFDLEAASLDTLRFRMWNSSGGKMRHSNPHASAR